MRLAGHLFIALPATLLLGAWLTVPVCAEVEPGGGVVQLLQAPPPSAPQTGPVDPRAYRLGPGDGLVLNLWGPISRSFPLEVGPEGQVFVQGIGSVRVAGLTLEDGRKCLEDLVRSQYRGVRVEVQLQRVRALVVYVTGEVRWPGPLVATGASRLADVLPDSLFAPGASRRNIRIRHRDGREITVDLGRFLLTGRGEQPAWIEDGDIIQVPRAVSHVGVWGGVARPGRYELGPADSLHDLLQLAGGLMPGALPERALFVRWSSPASVESTWVSTAQVESRAVDPPLRDGDNFYVFIIPEYHEVHQVGLTGQVSRVGDYPIQLGITRLSDAVHAAGGLRPDADSASIQLVRAPSLATRADPEFERLVRLPRESMTESEYESFRTRLAALGPDIRVDWRRLQGGSAALDPLLADGDVIRVNRLSNTVRVDGQVHNPGVYEFKPGAPWIHYVKLAGGFTDRAARTRVRVRRAVNGQTVLVRGVRTLTPGDLLWVPERPDITTWGQLKGLIAVAAQVATVIIAVRR